MKKYLLLATVLSTVWATGAMAASVSDLGNSLMPWGATKAGSADGMVPAYTGGIFAMSNLPASNPGPQVTNPFASEKPLFTVTPANMSQYDALLTPGEKALLQRYGAAGYYINVYPSHRTFYYPDWVNKNSIANASRVTEVQPPGTGETGAYGGIPFPIPTDGYEVMWDNTLAYHPAICHQSYQGYLVDTSGNVTFLGTVESNWVTTYYNPQATELPGKFFIYFKSVFHSPPPENGTTYLFQFPVNFNASDDVTWFYDPGTRRVRIAPEFKFDTPVASYGGSIDYDEIDLFYGSMEKFNFKLVGLEEKIVPYNDFDMFGISQDQLLKAQFINPAIARFEVHRVWVINAVLAPGQRHIYSQWNFYIDEDSYTILSSESYDHAGAIYRVGFIYPYINYYDGPTASNFTRAFNFYDLSKGNYMITRTQTMGNEIQHCSATIPNMSNYTPQSIAAQGLQ